ncbi:MAG: CehA/McbA family metallohydrolase [Planctomycetaceae bacterium]|nr:CehA/McbA family metallohydrolase [Planctomycetaceae bacterium]
MGHKQQSKMLVDGVCVQPNTSVTHPAILNWAIVHWAIVNWAIAGLLFSIGPAFGVSKCLASELTFAVVDAQTQRPLAARVYLNNLNDGSRHFVRSLSNTDAVIYEKQNWANKDSIEHHTSVPAGSFIAENLPAGTYQLTIKHGKEYFPETRTIALGDNENRSPETIALRRWVNMSELGWYSGETHLHRSLSELPVVMQAEDLNVAMPLTYWETRAFHAPTSGNKSQSGEIPDRLLTVDPTHVIWPRNTEYEIFTVNEHRHTLGALFVLNHKSELDLGVPNWGPVADRARAEGALMDMDKLDWPFGMTLPHTTGATLYELANNHLWRTEFGLTQWNTMAPAFMQPPLGGSSGDERDWLAYTLGQYYVLLNAGFQLVPTAGTASGVHPVPAGFSRVYVHLDQAFHYEDWLAGLEAGRSFVTTGPMVFAKVNDQLPGFRFAEPAMTNGSVKLSGHVLSEHPLATLEVVHNGRVVTSLPTKATATDSQAWRCEIEANIPIQHSGWLCIRCTEDRPDQRLRFAHTAPWYFHIVDKPLRPTRQEKEYLVQRVTDEMERSRAVLPATALTEYKAALVRFQNMEVSDDPVVLPSVTRVDSQPLLLLTNRLMEALETIGSPLSAEVRAELAALTVDQDETQVTATIQRLLDPLCIAAVQIDADGLVKATAGQLVTVEEHGWRAMLIKVINEAGLQTTLRCESPNALPIPHGPQADIANRWLSLSMQDGRPLDARLSGLGLEYRIVLVSSIAPGTRTAKLEFNAGIAGAKNSPVIRQWKFDKDADDWGNANDLQIEVREQTLHLTATGSDPYFSTPIMARGGKMILRFWGQTDSNEMGQVFWWTNQLPQPDGQRQATFQLHPGQTQEYKVEFAVEGDLAGVRIDPLQGPGEFRIERISLEYAADEKGTWANTNVTVETVPATKVEFRVTDADGSPCMGCFEIRDSQGRVYPAQPKRLAPDFFFHTQIYRETGESIMLPRGTYTVTCSHGPESVPEVKTIQVDEQPVVIEYQVQRWIDTAKLGYWSGDHHIHAAGCLHYENPTQGVHPPDMLRHIMGEDLKVGCCLTWGPCFDYQKQFFTGRPDDVSRYPYLLRYDVEVSGFGSHESGHLNLLKLKEQIPLGGDSKNHWPTLGLNTMKFAKKQGAVTGTAHSGNGLAQVVGRVAGVDGPHKLPCFDIPAFNGIGAHEFIMQVTHEVDGPNGEKVPAIDFIATMDTTREHEWNIWYHVLNCGIPIVASGETDFPCITGERVGLGRVYVNLPGILDYDEWVEGLRRGESYVSDGSAHLMNFERQADGSFTIDVATRKHGFPEVEVELIANGYPVEVQKVRADGELRSLTFPAPNLEQSSWLAVRIFPSAHTNPIWVKVKDKPVRVATSIEWCLASLEQCWKEKSRTYAPTEFEEARAAYDHARRVYQGMLDEIE